MNQIELEKEIWACEVKAIQIRKRQDELTKQIASDNRELRETHNQLRSLEQAIEVLFVSYEIQTKLRLEGKAHEPDRT